MKSKTFSHQRWAIALGLLFLAVGCGISIEPSVNPASLVPTVTAYVPSRSPVPATVTASPTGAPLPTSTTLPTQTSTSLATLSPDKAQAVVLDLLRNNAGCRLPCWWGFTPEQTSWETARQFLSTIATEIYIPASSPPSHFFADVIFLVPEEIFPTYLTQKYQVKDGVIETIETMPGYTSNYSLPVLLGAYGQPAEVHIRTYRQAREGDLPFDTVLFYPQQGIMVRYDSQAEKVGGRIRGCPQQRPALVLALWSPAHAMTFLEAANQTVEIRNEDWWPYRPVQEATGMDVETFYQTFKNSNNSICLETAADLWPQP